MKKDIEIARETVLHPIATIASSIGIPEEYIEPYGKYIAKVNIKALKPEKIKKSNLILVTAITPTKAGIGKTTVSIGLALGLNKIGKKAVVALREPSLGPVFGMKGGAAGGGYAQVLPMDQINLHFTGDFHAITSAHNTISALLDNYIYQNRNSCQGLSKVLWKRVLDVNDRNLRHIITGLGKESDGVLQQTGFDITAASEIMAVLCLAKDLDDLKERIENILLGYTKEGKPFTVKDLGVAGAITILLKDAMMPNLVQTIEHTPAFIHGGPFANIAHGCNSLVATEMALSYGDYAVTEAGFGADLGAEKFFDIKCRMAGLSPKLTVLVATLGALKMHGGTDEKEIYKPSLEGVRAGFSNLQRHVENLEKFGQTVLVCFNRFPQDTEEEIELVRRFCEDELKVGFAINTAFSKGGEGAKELAQLVVETIEKAPSKPLHFAYKEEDSIEEKVRKIAQNIYGAKSVFFDSPVQKEIRKIEEMGMSHYPVCIAKTQYSWTGSPKAYGNICDFELEIDDIVINSGAKMIVAIAGNMMRMPGLPKEPAALGMDIVDGVIEGLN